MTVRNTITFAKTIDHHFMLLDSKIDGLVYMQNSTSLGYMICYRTFELILVIYHSTHRIHFRRVRSLSVETFKLENFRIPSRNNAKN